MDRHKDCRKGRTARTAALAWLLFSLVGCQATRIEQAPSGAARAPVTTRVAVMSPAEAAQMRAEIEPLFTEAALGTRDEPAPTNVALVRLNPDGTVARGCVSDTDSAMRFFEAAPQPLHTPHTVVR